ncbi:hypothetical protein H9P43_000999 [Blastocladiella emersonii ATCC 22665]|nr:hypothetical protein H9P43_000999 [Blastocladiella emersonii ATCC 22665]
MSDKLAQFGRRAKKFIKSTGDDVARDLETRTASFTQLHAAFTDAADVEETVLKEAPTPSTPTPLTPNPADAAASSTTQSQKINGRAISAVAGRARKRGDAGNGWFNARTLESQPKSPKALTRSRSNDTDSSKNSSAKSHDALDGVESAVEQAASSSTIHSSRSSGSSTRRGGFGGSTSSDGLTDRTSSSVASALARPALQALQAFEEPDSDADLAVDVPIGTSQDLWAGADGSGSQLGSNGSLGSTGSSGSGGGTGSMRRNAIATEAVDLQLLAGAALSGCATVMAEKDSVWTWSAVLTEVSPLLKLPPLAEPRAGGDRAPARWVE